MKIQQGQKLINIKLPAIDGSHFDLESLSGRPLMISFFRFATCPFCNLRMNLLVNRFDELGKDFNIIAIFDSPLDNLIKYSSGHKAPFPVLADGENNYYKKYHIQHSVLGMLKGMMFRFPTLMKGMMKGYIPFPIKGSLTTMPADFLVDREGNIQEAYYGKDEGDHLDFEKIKEFSYL